MGVIVVTHRAGLRRGRFRLLTLNHHGTAIVPDGERMLREFVLQFLRRLGAHVTVAACGCVARPDRCHGRGIASAGRSCNASETDPPA